ncbi:MAG: LamG-like jellyroll fold domain-containing protein, partial [Pseudomonadota bacterium]
MSTVSGGTGNDTLDGGSSDDLIYGLAGNDSLQGDAGNDTIFGGTGADRLQGSDGADGLIGGSGDDLLYGDDLPAVRFNATGTDGVALESNFSDFPSTALSFEITYSTNETGFQTFASYATSGTSNALLVNADAGGQLNVHINNSSYTSSVDMDAFADGAVHSLAVTWDSATGDLRIYVDGSLADSTTHATGASIATGGTFALGQEQDSVGGGFSAAQTFDGDFHGASLYSDVRTLSEIQSSAGGAVAPDLGDANLISNWVADRKYWQIDDLTGNHHMSLSGDTVYVVEGSSADSLDGGDGNDTIYGGGGDDSVAGGAGNDQIASDSGNDVIDAGAGNDSVEFGLGNDLVYGGAGNDAIDDVFGNSITGEDTVYGGDGDDAVWAGFGNDTLFGGNDHDDLHGDDGNDTVDGGAGYDTIYGGAGDDVLDDQAGDDTVYGGSGNDTLVTSNAASGGDDLLYGGAGNDR